MILSFLRSLRKSGNGACAEAVARDDFESKADARFGRISDLGPFSVKKLNCDELRAGQPTTRQTPDEIDIWVIPTGIMPQLARSRGILSADERRHADGISHKFHHIRYVAVRAALRFALSYRFHDALETDQWRISTPPFGKPQLCSKQANCSFSITHADDFSVIAIAPGSTVGIDAEKVDSAKLKHLPLDCLSDNERDRIGAQSQDRQYYDFFRLWTLKEAYTKALGVGLSHEFDTIEFDLDTNDGAARAADAENYELLTLKYQEFDHLLAICLLGVADGKQHRPAKNLYVIDPNGPAAQTIPTHSDNTSKDQNMSVPLHIIDLAHPERIELFGLEDLPELLHESFEAQAEAMPHHTAIEFGGVSLSYRELDIRANGVANYLIGKGVRPGDRVALYQETTAELFISLLGILKAGGVYVPVDAKLTPEQVTRVVTEHDLQLIVTTAELSANLPAAMRQRLVLIDEERHSFEALSSQGHLFRTGRIASEDDSHVVFPNGRDAVVVSHGDAVRFSHSLAVVYGLEAHHRYHQDPSLAFDVALEEALAALSVGATIVAGDYDAAGSCEEKARFFAEQRITVLSTTPEVLAAFDDELPTVDILIVGGRVCPSDVAVCWALKTKRVVSLKRAGDRFPSFSIEQESGAAWRPRMLPPHASERPAA